MERQRIKEAESLDTVHTHHILTKRIGGQSGERATL